MMMVMVMVFNGDDDDDCDYDDDNRPKCRVDFRLTLLTHDTNNSNNCLGRRQQGSVL